MRDAMPFHQRRQRFLVAGALPRRSLQPHLVQIGKMRQHLVRGGGDRHRRDAGPRGVRRDVVPGQDAREVGEPLRRAGSSGPVPALQLGNGIAGRGIGPRAGFGFAVAGRGRTMPRRKQVAQLQADGRKDRRCITTCMAFHQGRPIVALGNAQAGAPVLMRWTTGRPALVRFPCAGQFGQ